ncbi:hypothetical protein MtrunA17_Chr3g0106551 [Medicago truncatula]|uniref:Uncharacterized protein n=1 Tax=Medicago truncatula TaxID=3880 RepID=A0A396ISW6_MEDTR|nr:hypothetical protein MtrunA17_Chr3g0106551 [Medicago truncatula]
MKCQNKDKLTEISVQNGKSISASVLVNWDILSSGSNVIKNNLRYAFSSSKPLQRNLPSSSQIHLEPQVFQEV